MPVAIGDSPSPERFTGSPAHPAKAWRLVPPSTSMVAVLNSLRRGFPVPVDQDFPDQTLGPQSNRFVNLANPSPLMRTHRGRITLGL